MGGLLARFGLIGAVLFGGWLFRDYLTGAAIDLEVGDCFDAPTTISDTVDEVAHHPCTDAHTAEVIFVADYAPSGGAYPGEDAFDAFTEANCPASFQAYVGRDFYTDTEYDIGVFYPIEEGWSQGDYEITCYLVRIDGGQMSQSVRVQ
jgi:hypothetical protein